MTAGIKGVWSLRASWMDAFDSHLVLSFVGETRLLAISEEDVLDEASIPGFDGDSQTLLAATTLHDQLLQVRCGGWYPRLLLGADVRSSACSCCYPPPQPVVCLISNLAGHQLSSAPHLRQLWAAAHSVVPSSSSSQRRQQQHHACCCQPLPGAGGLWGRQGVAAGGD